MSEDRDHSSDLLPGASDEEIQSLQLLLPVKIPLAWLNVLRVSNGFGADNGLASPPFQALSVHQLRAIALDPEEWKLSYDTVKENIFPIAIDVEAGFFALDLSGVTPKGECPVVRISPYSRDEEFRMNSVAEFLEASLNEEDFGKFKPLIPASRRREDINAALIRAAFRGHLKKVKALLAEGADIEAQDEHGCTPLIAAPVNKNKSVVEFLMRKGANVNAKSNLNATALTEAARIGDIEIVRLLLRGGADINVRSWNGTALNQALMNKCYDIAYLLLECGADPNDFSYAGSTPLMEAISRRDVELTAALLAHGADVHLKNSHGQTALSTARENQNRATTARARPLDSDQQRMAEEIQRMRAEIKEQDEAIMILLQNAGAVDQTDTD